MKVGEFNHFCSDESSRYSNGPIMDKDLEEWEADIEAEVEAFRKRLEELSAPLKNKPKVGAFPHRSTTCKYRIFFAFCIFILSPGEQSLRKLCTTSFQKTNENSSKTSSVGIL